MNKHTLCTASRIKAHKTMLHRATKKSHGVKRLLKPAKEILNKNQTTKIYRGQKSQTIHTKQLIASVDNIRNSPPFCLLLF